LCRGDGRVGREPLFIANSGSLIIVLFFVNPDRFGLLSLGVDCVLCCLSLVIHTYELRWV
jgi:hypothetical protein